VFHKINFVLGRWLVIVSNLIPIVQTETKQDVGLVSSNRTFNTLKLVGGFEKSGGNILKIN
jgi:hypothetical protein